MAANRQALPDLQMQHTPGSNRLVSLLTAGVPTGSHADARRISPDWTPGPDRVGAAIRID